MGHRIIMYFGLALALLVGLFTLWGGLSLGGLTRLGIPEILKYWSIPLLIALGLTFFSVLAKRKPPTKRCSSAAAVAAGVFVLGGYAVLFMETTGVLRLATVSTSAILVGVGYGLLSLVWQHRLSSLAFDDVVKTLLFALVIQSAGYLLLFALLQDRTWMVFPFLVALAVVFCLITLRLPKSNEDRRTNSKRRKGALKSAVAELSDPLLCVCAIAFAVALTRAITLDGIERTDSINLIEVEKHARYAYPLSTFILTLIGVSLSSRKVRGGTGLHIGIGTGLCFSYILFNRFFEEFAKSGTLPPGLAVWLPNIIYLGIAVYLYRKAPK